MIAKFKAKQAAEAAEAASAAAVVVAAGDVLASVPPVPIPISDSVAKQEIASPPFPIADSLVSFPGTVVAAATAVAGAVAAGTAEATASETTSLLGGIKTSGGA